MNEKKEVRQLSNKKNLILIMVSIGVLIIGVVGICWRVRVDNNKWLESWWGSISLIIAGFSALIMLYGIGNYRSYKKINIQLCNLPYAFDYQKELFQHEKIGCNKEKTKSKYDGNVFSLYSEWKEYLLKNYENIFENETNRMNFYRYINKTYRNRKEFKEIILIVTIPIELFLVTVAVDSNIFGDGIYTLIAVILLSLFLLVFFTINICNINAEIYFLKDVREIFKKKDISVK